MNKYKKIVINVYCLITIQSEVRRMYRYLYEEDEEFPGYNTNLG